MRHQPPAEALVEALRDEPPTELSALVAALRDEQIFPRHKSDALVAHLRSSENRAAWIAPLCSSGYEA